MRKLKGDLSAEVAVQKDSPVNYGSEFHDLASLAKLFLHHEENIKIINIIQQGSRYHLDPIPTRTDIYRKVGGERGEPDINNTPLLTTRRDRESGAAELEVHERSQVKKESSPTRTDRDSGAAFSGVGGAQGERTQTGRLTVVAQDAVSEYASTLVGYRTGLAEEAEVGRRINKIIDWGDGGK